MLPPLNFSLSALSLSIDFVVCGKIKILKIKKVKSASPNKIVCPGKYFLLPLIKRKKRIFINVRVRNMVWLFKIGFITRNNFCFLVWIVVMLSTVNW